MALDWHADHPVGRPNPESSSAPPASIEEVIDALRPPLEEPLAESPRHVPHEPRHLVSSWRVQLLLGALVALMVWPLAAWDPSEGSIETSVAGEVLERRESPSTSSTTLAPALAPPGTGTTTSTATTTTASPPPEPAPAAVPTTTEPTRPPSTTTTSTTTTTTAPPPEPAPIAPQATSQVFPGVQLRLAAAAPASGAPRTAEFRLDVEFGDVRVLRAVRFDFGDGAGSDAPVVPWSCGDPAAPNPYVLSGITHRYAASGSYPVTVTVRTAPCDLGTGDLLSEETVQMQLTLIVP